MTVQCNFQKFTKKEMAAFLILRWVADFSEQVCLAETGNNSSAFQQVNKWKFCTYLFNVMLLKYKKQWTTDNHNHRNKSQKHAEQMISDCRISFIWKFRKVRKGLIYNDQRKTHCPGLSFLGPVQSGDVRAFVGKQSGVIEMFNSFLVVVVGTQF